MFRKIEFFSLDLFPPRSKFVNFQLQGLPGSTPFQASAGLLFQSWTQEEQQVSTLSPFHTVLIVKFVEIALENKSAAFHKIANGRLTRSREISRDLRKIDIFHKNSHHAPKGFADVTASVP